MNIRFVVFVTLAAAAAATAGAARAAPAIVIVTPPAPPPVVVTVQPATPQPQPQPDHQIPNIVGLSIGYRADEVSSNFLNGMMLKVVWGVPTSGLEIVFSPSFSFGSDGAGDSLGHVELSLGARYVFNKHGIVKPYVLLAPTFTASSITSGGDEVYAYSAGGQAGAGVDIDLRRPGTLSFDIRAGRGVDTDTEQITDWDLLATASIGLYFPEK
jgi:hypothetical protein